MRRVYPATTIEQAAIESSINAARSVVADPITTVALPQPNGGRVSDQRGSGAYVGHRTRHSAHSWRESDSILVQSQHVAGTDEYVFQTPPTVTYTTRRRKISSPRATVAYVSDWSELTAETPRYSLQAERRLARQRGALLAGLLTLDADAVAAQNANTEAMRLVSVARRASSSLRRLDRLASTLRRRSLRSLAASVASSRRQATAIKVAAVAAIRATERQARLAARPLPQRIFRASVQLSRSLRTSLLIHSVHIE